MSRLILSCAFLIATSAPFTAAPASLSAEVDAARLAKLFPATGWAAGPNGYGGPADGEWTYALGGGKGTTLYHDGRQVGKLPGKPVAGNWAMHLNSTWHRHLSLFGFGTGDMG